MPFNSSATSIRPASHFSGGLRLRAGVGLGLALLAGLLTFGLIQSFHPVFRVPKEFDVPIIGMPSERFAAHRREQDRVDRWHAMLYNGALGLLIAKHLGKIPAVHRCFVPLMQ